MLLALLVVIAGIPGAELLMAAVGFCVLASVVLHGATAWPVAGWYGRKVAREVLAEEREDTAAALFRVEEGEADRITPAELAKLLASDEPPVILDVRARSTYESDGVRIPGGVRVRPDEALEWLSESAEDRRVVAYCT